jgi:hypothetical protein
VMDHGWAKAVNSRLITSHEAGSGGEGGGLGSGVDGQRERIGSKDSNKADSLHDCKAHGRLRTLSRSSTVDWEGRKTNFGVTK